eukprot:2026968-Alexandrium_andersonii.AAC.1
MVVERVPGVGMVVERLLSSVRGRGTRTTLGGPARPGGCLRPGPTRRWVPLIRPWRTGGGAT